MSIVLSGMELPVSGAVLELYSTQLDSALSLILNAKNMINIKKYAKVATMGTNSTLPHTNVFNQPSPLCLTPIALNGKAVYAPNAVSDRFSIILPNVFLLTHNANTMIKQPDIA